MELDIQKSLLNPSKVIVKTFIIDNLWKVQSWYLSMVIKIKQDEVLLQLKSNSFN